MNELNFYKVRDVVEDISSGLCSDVNAPASHLPEKVVDWIAETFISDYLEEGENRLPEVNDVLKGICDYLQEECSADADELREKERKIDEIKTSLENMGYSIGSFSDSDLVEIYDKTYDLIAEYDIYKDSLEVAVKSVKDNKKKVGLHISMAYTFVGDTSIEVPSELLEGKSEYEKLKVAYKYAKEHIDEIPVADNAEYVSDSDSFDLEDCDFEDTNEDYDASEIITKEMIKSGIKAGLKQCL